VAGHIVPIREKNELFRLDDESAKTQLIETQVVHLSEETGKISLSEVMRAGFIKYILWAIALTNATVFVLIIVIWVSEHNLLVAKLIAPSDRTITKSVISTLLAATAVQLGAALMAITHFLFKTNRLKEDDRSN
jgi:hypothetical protein